LPNKVVAEEYRRKKSRLQSSVTVGRHTYGVSRKKVFGTSEFAPLTVGAFCSIAGDVSFMCSGGSHSPWAATTFPIYSRLMDSPDPTENGGKPSGITIANDVWIGRHAMIMPGVHIADGAIDLASDSFRRPDCFQYQASCMRCRPLKALRQESPQIGL